MESSSAEIYIFYSLRIRAALSKPYNGCCRNSARALRSFSIYATRLRLRARPAWWVHPWPEQLGDRIDEALREVDHVLRLLCRNAALRTDAVIGNFFELVS